MYLAATLDSKLESRKYRLLGAPFYETIVRVLRRAVGEKDLKFRYELFDDFSPDEYCVSGLYDMHEDSKYVIFNFSKHANSLSIDYNRWKEFKFLISQAIQHEAIHQLQWQNRDGGEDPVKLDFRSLVGNTEDDKEYLSDPDEIDAYGHDIAMEIKFYYPNKNPYKVLSKIQNARKIPSYRYYKNTFKDCEWSKIHNKLLTKTYKWIPHV